MTLQERLKQFIKYKGLTYKSFEVMCGLGNGTAKRFNETIKRRTVDSIVATFPDINRDWLLTGEGEMLRPRPVIEQQNNGGQQNITFKGDVNSDSETGKLIEALVQQQSISRKSQEQIDRLLAIIEKMQGA